MDTTEKLRAQSTVVREDLRELGHLGRAAAQEKIDEARRAAGELEGRVLDYVRQRPVKSLLIAAGVGCLLGWMWSRR